MHFGGTLSHPAHTVMTRVLSSDPHSVPKPLPDPVPVFPAMLSVSCHWYFIPCPSHTEICMLPPPPSPHNHIISVSEPLPMPFPLPGMLFSSFPYREFLLPSKCSSSITTLRKPSLISGWICHPLGSLLSVLNPATATSTHTGFMSANVTVRLLRTPGGQGTHLVGVSFPAPNASQGTLLTLGKCLQEERLNSTSWVSEGASQLRCCPCLLSFLLAQHPRCWPFLSSSSQPGLHITITWKLSKLP